MNKTDAKKVEAFKKLVSEGIFNLLDPYEDERFVTALTDKVSNFNEGSFFREAITFNEVLLCADERGELETLTFLAAKECGLKIEDKKNKISPSDYGRTLKNKLVSLIGLRDYCTEKEILKELEFRLS